MLSRIVCQAITGCSRPSSAHRPACVSMAPVLERGQRAGGAGELADQHALASAAPGARGGARSPTAGRPSCSRRSPGWPAAGCCGRSSACRGASCASSAIAAEIAASSPSTSVQRLADLQHRGGVGDVLRGGAPVAVLAELVAAQRVELRDDAEDRDSRCARSAGAAAPCRSASRWQWLTISSAASCGIRPESALHLGQRALRCRGTSAVRFSSDQTWRIASVVKMPWKMAESMMVDGHGGSSDRKWVQVLARCQGALAPAARPGGRSSGRRAGRRRARRRRRRSTRSRPVECRRRPGPARRGSARPARVDAQLGAEAVARATTPGRRSRRSSSSSWRGDAGDRRAAGPAMREAMASAAGRIAQPVRRRRSMSRSRSSAKSSVPKTRRCTPSAAATASACCDAACALDQRQHARSRAARRAPRRPARPTRPWAASPPAAGIAQQPQVVGEPRRRRRR